MLYYKFIAVPRALIGVYLPHSYQGRRGWFLGIFDEPILYSALWLGIKKQSMVEDKQSAAWMVWGVVVGQKKIESCQRRWCNH